MKNWHYICLSLSVPFFCSTPQSHSSVPTCALAVPSRAAVVKDGRRLRRPPHQRREASLTTASTAAHLACRAATSHFRFPCSLRDEGSGSGKPIKCDDNEPIKVRDPAYGTATPGILSPVVMRRTEKRKKSSSARHCDQIRFRFHPTWVKTRHGERSTGTSVALQIADDFVAQVGRSVRKYCGLLPKARKNGLD